MIYSFDRFLKRFLAASTISMVSASCFATTMGDDQEFSLFGSDFLGQMQRRVAAKEEARREARERDEKLLVPLKEAGVHSYFVSNIARLMEGWNYTLSKELVLRSLVGIMSHSSEDGDYKVCDILHLLGGVKSEEELNSITQSVIAISAKSDGRYEPWRLVKMVKALPADERNLYVGQVKRLIDHSGIDDKEVRFELAALQTPQEREAMVDTVLDLFSVLPSYNAVNEGMCLSNCISELRNLSTIEERRALASLVKLQFRPGLSTGAVMHLMRELREIEDPERRAALGRAQMLTNDHIHFTQGIGHRVREYRRIENWRDLEACIQLVAGVSDYTIYGFDSNEFIKTLTTLATAQAREVVLQETVECIEQLGVARETDWGATEILKKMIELRQQSRQNPTAAAVLLVTREMGVHDKREIFRALSGLEDGLDPMARAQEVASRLEQDMQEHNFDLATRFARTIELIANPTAAFSRMRMNVEGQEAITRAREDIYAGFEMLWANNERMQAIFSPENLNDAAFRTAVAAIRKTLQWKQQETKIPSEVFRVEVALQGLERLETDIRADFVPQEKVGHYPTIRGLASALYGLSEVPPMKEFISTHLAMPEVFTRMQAAFPDVAGKYSTVGTFLQNEQQFVDRFTALVMGEVDTIGLPLTRESLNFIKDIHNARKYAALETYVDVLMMSMRGHCLKLDNPKERNKMACSDGVYLGFLRAIGELSKDAQAAKRMHRVDVVACAQVV